MAKFAAALMPKFNGYGGSSPYYTNDPARENRIKCGVNCNCARKRKFASEKSVPGYEYIKYLGEGGNGAVHLYRDKETREPVAIKSIRFENVYHEVESEYDIGIKIRHPNIIQYYSFYANSSAKTCYIVMEYAKHGSLRKWIDDQERKREYFDRSTVLRVIHDIISGVEYLNSQRVVHCDLKPENILVGDDGNMKICDFGTAQYDYDMNDSFCGTTVYMAPELSMLKDVRPTEKSEVWAIGIILYELCNLRHPFENAFYMRTGDFLPYLTNGKIPPTTNYYGKDMSNFLMAMLDVNPDRRCTLGKCLSLCENLM